MYEVIIPLLAGIATVVVVFCGAYLTHMRALLKEAGDVLTALANALEDGHINQEEVATIVKEAIDVIEAAKKFRKTAK